MIGVAIVFTVGCGTLVVRIRKRVHGESNSRNEAK